MGLEDSLNALVLQLKDILDVLLFAVILLLVIIILKIIEKELRTRLKIRKNDRNLFYKKEIKKLAGSGGNPERILEDINRLSRDFFKEAFGFPYSLEYSELIPKFKKIGKKEGVTFCNLISEANYSGEEVKREKLKVLIGILMVIIEKNRIYTTLEKMKLEEKKKKEEIQEQKKKKTEEKISRYKESLSFIFRLKNFFSNLRKRMADKRLEKELRKYSVS